MKKLNVSSVIAGAVGFLTATTPVWAQGILNPNDKPPNAGNITDMRTGVVGIINYFLLFLGLVAVAFIIWAGITMTTSRGNEQKMKEGMKTITYAIIGLIIVFLAYAIVNMIANVPGVGSGTG